jgi:hypothetical protein
VQTKNLNVIAALAAALALSACATGGSPGAPAASGGGAVPTTSLGQRDLTPQEKTAIVNAVAPSLRNPGAAKYRWAKFPAIVNDEMVNYCATVDAQSPFPAYSGQQAYIVEAHMTAGRVSSAVMGLIAGGKDFAIVTKMCAKYGLDPKNAS